MLITRKARAEIFSKNLLDIMRSRGMDHQMLAAKTGKPLRTVYNWTQGINIPRDASIAVIAKALNCKVTDLTDKKLSELSEDVVVELAKKSNNNDNFIYGTSSTYEILKMLKTLDNFEALSVDNLYQNLVALKLRNTADSCITCYDASKYVDFDYNDYAKNINFVSYVATHTKAAQAALEENNRRFNNSGTYQIDLKNAFWSIFDSRTYHDLKQLDSFYLDDFNKKNLCDQVSPVPDLIYQEAESMCQFDLTQIFVIRQLCKFLKESE